MTTRSTTPALTLASRTLVKRDGTPVSLRDAAAEGAPGTFEGYACLWDVVDAYGTRFAPGAFTAGGLDGEPYALLWMHDPYEPRGVFTAVEDEVGLYVTGSWDQSPDGQAARAAASSGSAPEMSVGFIARTLDEADENRFTGCELVEVSQVTRRMAAVPGAAFSEVRGVVRPKVSAVDAEDAESEAARQRAIALLTLS